MALFTKVEEWRRRAVEQTGTLLFECTAQQRRECRTVFFERPNAVLEARSGDELRELLPRLDQALQSGSWVAGYLSYEGACALLLPASPTPDNVCLAWFGVYDAPEQVEGGTGAEQTAPVATFPLCWEMEMSREQYFERVRQVQQRLAEGQSYQMNLTTAVRSGYRGDLLSLYTALAKAQPSAFSALLHPAEGEMVMSFSPEMLFRVEAGGRIVARPMKGTAPAADDEQDLRTDEKNRAEHVMIVDLLRNDLGRVCEPGSVAVDDIFAVERYRTLLQMTSTISGQLREKTPLSTLLQALLPAGSMTGAPKRRTVEMLREIELGPRGIYSGAVGFAGPDGTAVFSVPIRTVELREQQLRMGVGGGVVADSTPEEELAECWLKARFLTEVSARFDLVETLQWNGEGYLWLDAHMDRLEPSAGRLGYVFDRAGVLRQLEEFGPRLGDRQRRVRLMLARDGSLRLEDSDLEEWLPPVAVTIAPEPVWSGDTFLRHKTTFRPVYDAGLAKARADGFQEALFANERGELLEGAISSLVLRLDGRWVTPALSSGLLPGVARGLLLARGEVHESIVQESDLDRAEVAVMVNGVRGLAQVRRLRRRDGTERTWEAVDSLPHY